MANPDAPMRTAKPGIVTPELWRAPREALLEREKAHTRARDALAAERRRMPMMRVQQDHRFTAPGGGDATLLDLFTLRDDFDAGHDVERWHGTNVFLRDGDEVYRTYFIDARGDEALGSTWNFLDITPYGRQEEWEDSPEDWPQTPP